MTLPPCLLSMSVRARAACCRRAIGRAPIIRSRRRGAEHAGSVAGSPRPPPQEPVPAISPLGRCRAIVRGAAAEPRSRRRDDIALERRCRHRYRRPPRRNTDDGRGGRADGHISAGAARPLARRFDARGQGAMPPARAAGELGGHIHPSRRLLPTQFAKSAPPSLMADVCRFRCGWKPMSSRPPPPPAPMMLMTARRVDGRPPARRR